ncbi:MAG TPA: serine/threonine-protein kinase [Polyangia bacterium]|nr:serine/threonine-protein kinase [Polyangia bacterium]
MTVTQDQNSTLSELDPLLGRAVADNFRIDGLIGSGAMGNVYRAEQLSLGKAVAIKVLHQHLMGDDKLVARFKREAKSASMLNHPNSIQIIDSGQDRDGTLYIAMELLAGRDLAQVIRDDFPLPLPRVVRILSQVLSALEEAHARGVIHRDLKPSNIMLTSRREERDFVKVCDFGIAKATLDDGKDDRAAMLTIQGLVCGTPEYMSPEQARAETIDGRADLYSVAVILYQMVTGDIPFRADSPVAIVSRHLVEPPLAPSRRRPDLRLPKIVDDVVLRGLEKDRELRYPTAAAFREVLEGVLGATSGPATPLPPGAGASSPTMKDISGTSSPGTATVPAQPPSARFGATANMTGRSRRQTPVLVLGLTALFAVSVAAAVYTFRVRSQMKRADLAAMAALEAARAAPLPPPRAPSPIPAATAAPTPARAPEAPETAAEPAPVPPVHEHARPHHHASAAGSHTPPVAATDVAAPAGEIAPAPAGVPSAAPARDVTQVLGEAAKLLAQGEVSDACARGEEAKRLGPRVPAVYKFLGKCYMRAGRARDANDNYRNYLDLAPGASDAPFVKSMIK